MSRVVIGSQVVPERTNIVLMWWTLDGNHPTAVTIEQSTDLTNWQTFAETTNCSILIPATLDREYFRLRMP